MRSTAAVWEMLAFVKLRAVGGDIDLAGDVEHKTRSIIHERALTVGAKS
jgi:glutamine synthetase adenylyltransferase